jgi:hypothetical protein
MVKSDILDPVQLDEFYAPELPELSGGYIDYEKGVYVNEKTEKETDIRE